MANVLAALLLINLQESRPGSKEHCFHCFYCHVAVGRGRRYNAACIHTRSFFKFEDVVLVMAHQQMLTRVNTAC